MRSDNIPSFTIREISFQTHFLVSILGCCLLAMLVCGNPAYAKSDTSNTLTLNSKLTILIEPDEPSAIVEATKDLAEDLEKVLGTRPEIVNRAEDAGPITILVGVKSKLVQRLKPAQAADPESFSISVTSARLTKGKSAQIVLLTGADIRGTIFGVYQFSEDFLGIDPMYYWTDHQPAHQDHVEISLPLKKTFSAPVFKYRGFFINDEDLLTAWAPGEKKDGTGISLEAWNKIFETILRLKGNIVCPGTWIFPDEPQVRLAGKRGLIITQHHAIPLGLNVARWPHDVPYSYTEHAEILEQAWKDAVNQYPRDQEILWTVGLRGLSDTSYASFDPSVRNNDRALGELITKAIADQMSIVRSVHPDAKFITSLWQEGARLVQEGYLKIPPEIGLVWADTGYGYLQDKGLVKAGQGAYYHVAMMNGRANQLSEMVPMARVESELGRYIKAGATHYLLINTSDIRPVSMMAKAVMDVGWKGLATNSTGDGMEFYRDWSAEEFGSRAASKVADVYEQYFDAPAHLPGEVPELEYGDNYYHTEARGLLLAYMVGSPLYYLPGQSPKWVTPRIILNFGGENSTQQLAKALNEEIQRCDDAQLRWDAVWKIALEAESSIDADRKPFYHAHVLAMIEINKESNRILSLVAKAVQFAKKGQTTQAQDALRQAYGSFEEIRKAEDEGEYGKWKGWYRGDWLTGIDRTRELVQIFERQLNDPQSPMPVPALWSGWEAYYHIMHYEGDRSANVK